MRPSRVPAADAAGIELSPRLLGALRLLAEARAAAARLSINPWEFAVGLPELLTAGLSGTDVRWLVARRLVEHAREHLRPRSGRRSFRRIVNCALTRRSCFVIAPAGLPLAGPAVAAAPRWDAGRRQLWYGDQLVKWYRVPAASQETVLAAFEEDGWPSRIDDPLPRAADRDPRERLHEAVKGLNRGQAAWLLVFRRDGTGEGVVWAARQGR